MYGYDEEAVYQDADILQAQYEEESAAAAAAKRRGECQHGWQLGHGHIYNAEQIEEMRQRGDFPDRKTEATEWPEGRCLCLDCGVIGDDPLAGRR